MRDQSYWDNWFLGLAQYIATASKDPSTKVGAVIVDANRRVISVGYNGFARGVDDSPERLNDREVKYDLTVHAEKNAILFAQEDLAGCTVYTWPFPPCAPCAAMIVQSGITRVVAPNMAHCLKPLKEGDNARPDRWKASCDRAVVQFKEAGVELCYA